MLTCYDCGAAAPRDALLCPRCSSTDLTKGRAAPRAYVPDDHDLMPGLPFPWRAALGRTTPGSIVALFGPPGSGKSALCAVLRPSLWLTAEQTAQQAMRSIWWANGGEHAAPARVPVSEVRQPGDVERELERELGDGIVVLDSLTRIGSYHEQKHLLEVIETWAQGAPGRAAFVVLQVNADGEPAGLREVEHLTTAVAGVSSEPTGLQRLYARKNRDGGLGSAYFRLTAAGLGPAELPYSYSVEGRRGAYRLHPYPLPGAKWAGGLAARFGAGDVVPGLAHAGQCVKGYPRGLLLPADHDERKAFAEAHGLTWIR